MRNDNEIIIRYKVNKNDLKLRIFGANFVKKNEALCKFIYENQSYEMREFLKLNNIPKKNISEIILTGINNITNMSYIFNDCSSLFSLPDISKWNTKNVTNMSYLFCNCSSLSSLPDISKWNTSNVTNMSFMFSNCSSLSSLPDISKWNTNNVTDISFIFKNCIS